jgi:hypothetical protein
MAYCLKYFKPGSKPQTSRGIELARAQFEEAFERFPGQRVFHRPEGGSQKNLTLLNKLPHALLADFHGLGGIVGEIVAEDSNSIIAVTRMYGLPYDKNELEQVGTTGKTRKEG